MKTSTKVKNVDVSGKEWEAEVNKLTKEQIIVFLRQKLLLIQRAKKVIENYDPENGDPGGVIHRIENILYDYSG